jgi:hypothetical protein
VSGDWIQWGWDGYPDNVGWLFGTVTGNELIGSYSWSLNPVGQGAGPVDWTLADGGQTFTGNNVSSGVEYVWCGSRPGLPLLPGCGWSGTFETSNWGEVTLVQSGDEVQGVAVDAGIGLAGTVFPRNDPNGAPGLSCNGAVFGDGGVISRFSWALDQELEATFVGNELPLGASAPVPFCGARLGVSLPSPCFGGGGPLDGLWFTNQGALVIDQPIDPGNYADLYTSINWVPWGIDGGYDVPNATINGIPSQNQSIPYAQLLTGGAGWHDASWSQGGNDLVLSFTDAGLTLWGSGNNGSLFCGSIYFPDPNGYFTDPIGVLPPGCGLTNEWSIWSPHSGPVSISLTQRRDQLLGSVGISGVAAATDAGAVYFQGPGGSFNWFPASDDQSFAGDNGGDAGWCGSLDAGQPSPCFE